MRHRRRISQEEESGLGLIELMAAIFILGIVLTAVAASLITFTRSASNSERRVQATALLNELHEEFQATPFELAGIRSDEVDDLDGFADAWSGAPPSFTFDGRQGVVIVEDCDADDASCRRSPRAYRRHVVNERETYDIFQAVTWVDRSGDGVPDSKRLTSEVTWTWLGLTTVETFESELAPVAPEVAEPDIPSLTLIVNPDPSVVDDDNELAGPIGITALPSVPVSAVTITFERWEWVDPSTPTTGTLVTESIELARDAGAEGLLFEGSIPTSLGGAPTLLPVGPLRIDAVAPTDPPSTVPAELEGRRTIAIVGDGRSLVELEGGEDEPEEPEEPDPDLEPPDEDVAIITATADPTSVAFNSNGFKCDLTIRASVTGLTPTNGSVVVVYPASGGGTRTVALTPEGEILSAGTFFSTILGKKNDHGISTVGSRPFVVVAGRSGPGAQSTESTVSISFADSGSC